MLTIIENLLSDAELASIDDCIHGAQWLDGQLTAGEQARSKKYNEEMDQTCQSWQTINQLVATKLYAHADFQSSTLPSKLSAAFVSRCLPGMHYGRHIDDPVMGSPNARYRCDVAITVFLSQPDSYQGGELGISTQFGQQTIKGAAGSAVVYPASSIHEVNPVTNGERLVCVMWSQSMIRDPARREILYELDTARRALLLSAPDAQVTSSVDHAYSNLVRMWADV